MKGGNLLLPKSDFNHVILIGKLEDPFRFAYNEKNESIYTGKILLARLSREVDRIPIEISKKFLGNLEKDVMMSKIKVVGHIISYTHNGKLKFTVRVDEPITLVSMDEPDCNHVKVSGAICSTIKCRERQNSKTVCDFRIASVSESGEKAYVPMIAWNDLARFISGFKCGSRLFLEARIQSRNFKVKNPDGNSEERISYELSIKKIRKVK